MIKQPIDMSFSDKKFSMILYGSPGLGKTTLALSAPAPVLIDFDRGVSRVKAYHRKTTIVCQTYEEVLEDIRSPEIKDCQTIIIDTGGSFVTYLQDWAMRTNPAQNRQKNGALSLKGFGAVKQEFQRFTNMVRDTMNKNIIYIFHSDEQKDKDGNPMQRLQCEGAARNLVWQPCDLGAYMQMIGNRRVVNFTPTDEFFAKGCYGIDGQREVPTIGPTDKNDFLARLFDEARANIDAENDAFIPIKEQYDAVMADAREIIAAINTAEEANAAAEILPNLEHALTSKKECGALLNERAKEIGLVWDKTNKKYISSEAA
jgi:hypothetical protein